jgi:hypothetical protein
MQKTTLYLGELELNILQMMSKRGDAEDQSSAIRRCIRDWGKERYGDAIYLFTSPVP